MSEVENLSVRGQVTAYEQKPLSVRRLREFLKNVEGSLDLYITSEDGSVVPLMGLTLCFVEPNPVAVLVLDTAELSPEAARAEFLNSEGATESVEYLHKRAAGLHGPEATEKARRILKQLFPDGEN